MINETTILLSVLEHCSEHRLAKYIDGHLVFTTDIGVNYYKPLQQTFSRVIAYDYGKRMTEIGVKGVNEEIIALARKEHPKYVVWLSAMYELLESTFDTIRKEGIIVVGWLVDDEYRFAYYSKWWVPHLDYCVTGDIEAVPKYKALGAKVIHIFPCVGVPIERNWANLEEKYDVSFVGWRDKTQREQYVNEIKKRNISIHLFGRGWEGGYVSAEKMINIFKTSKINLNFSGAGRRRANKGRLTEVCLAGGFLLTEYAPDLENYFEIDKEIVCFKNAKEMIEKITYYLSHDEERRTIARAGWERSTNEHTPYHMFLRVFEKIEKDLVDGNIKTQSPQLKMPLWIRRAPSRYYFQWGRAFLEEGYDSLWKDALSLSLAYNPFNTAARYYYVAGISPMFIRIVLFKLYHRYDALEKSFSRLCIWLFEWADSVPYLKNIKRIVSKKISFS